MLFERFGDPDFLRSALEQKIPMPFPTADDREPWLSLPENVSRAAITAAVSCLGKPLEQIWPPLPASLYMECSRNDNRIRYEASYFRRRDSLKRLVIAECIEDEGRFVDAIVDGVWYLLDEATWVIPAHLTVEEHLTSLPDGSHPVIDLFSAETGALLAWIVYLLGARLAMVSPSVEQRIRTEVQRRIIIPFMTQNFPWMGFNTPERVSNWNPWCNSNCLAVFLLLAEDVAQKTDGVRKILRSLDRFVDGYPADGSCDEGVSYFDHAAGKLFDALELLQVISSGTISVFEDSKIQEMGRYIWRMYLGNGYFVNFGDASARPTIAADMVSRYGRKIGDQHLIELGRYYGHLQNEDSVEQSLVVRHEAPSSLYRDLATVFDSRELFSSPRSGPRLARDIWLPDAQIMVARVDSGTMQGPCLVAKGGHNGENHNHNDVGSVVVYWDGVPVLIDVGVGIYTRKTFGPDRYTLWPMRSAYHNLPTIRGVEEHAGGQYRATVLEYRKSSELTSLSLDLSRAYPEAAGLQQWLRTATLHRTPRETVSVRDQFRLADVTQDIAWHWLTPHGLKGVGPGRMCVDLPDRAGFLILQFDDDLVAEVERIPVDDTRLQEVWGSEIYRLTLTLGVPTHQGDRKLEVSIG